MNSKPLNPALRLAVSGVLSLFVLYLFPAGCPMTAVGTGEQVEMLLNFFDIALFPELASQRFLMNSRARMEFCSRMAALES